jgi:hypothetical protein
MKLIMMAAALMLGSAAVAQTTEETTEDSTEDTTTTTTSTTMPAGTTTTSTTMPAGRMVAPGNTAPERDARGIPVVSAPAAAPAGYNQAAQMVPAGTPMPTMARPTPSAAGELPPCSRTVTDRCTQTYERGRAR